MKYMWIGTIVNTHGIKGELRIQSDAEYKDYIFQKGNPIYIGAQKEEQIISSYRTHKTYDMVTFQNFNHINDVLQYKGKSVYIDRDKITFPTFLKQDLIGMEAFASKPRGKITAILNSKAHDIFVIEGQKKYLVPYIDPFIEKIDIQNKIVYIKDMRGLFDEN